MKISELQTELSKIASEHGDLQVLIDSDEEYFSEEFDLELVMLDGDYWKNEDQFKDDYCQGECSKCEGHNEFKPQAVVLVNSME
jgi:hypothetical protein